MKRMFFLAIWLSSLASLTSWGSDLTPLVLYVNEFNLPGLKMACADRTFEAVSKAIAPRQLIVKTVTIEDLDKALSQNKADMAIVGSAIYWRHVANGMRDIATLQTLEQPDPDHAVGALVLARGNDDRINSVDDLKDKRLGVNHRIGFQGYLVLLKDLIDEGHDIDKFFKSVNFYGLEPEPRLEALRSSEIDATTLNVCYVERQQKLGNNVLKGLKPVGLRKGAETKCMASTTLYPNWTFLISPKLDSMTIVKVANALYNMSSGSDGQKWTIASDFRSADNLYKTLKTGPYAYLREWTLSRVWNEYKEEFFLAAFFILFVFFHYAWTRYQVKVKTLELRKAIKQQMKLAEFTENLRRKYEQSQKAQVVNQISSIIAHELSQPLSSILLYANGIKTYLKTEDTSTQSIIINRTEYAIEKIISRANKAEEIVKLVRDYARSSKRLQEKVNLKEVAKTVLTAFFDSGQLKPIDVDLEVPSKLSEVLGDKLEFELVFANLIKNSLEATRKQKTKIFIVIKDQKSEIKIQFSDNGPPIDDSLLNEISQPLFTLKSEGLGLGLPIVVSIIEKYGGNVQFAKAPLGALMVSITLPVSVARA